MFNIIIVDDEPLIREGISEGIQWGRLGCDLPKLAENGLEAIEMLKQNTDIVITDVKMPGLDGIELAKWINENQNQVSVIILSGYDDFQFAQNAISYGVTEYILKPTKLDEVEKAVSKAIKKIGERLDIDETCNLAKDLMEYKKEQEAIDHLIFNRIYGQGNFPQESEYKDFKGRFRRVAILQICDTLPDFLAGAGYWAGLVKSIDNFIKGSAKKAIGTVMQSQEDEIVICFYGDTSIFIASEFITVTDRFFSELKDKICHLVPSRIVMEISGADQDINSLKKLYCDAMTKCEAARQESCTVDGGLREIDLYKLFGKDFSTPIIQKDFQKVCEMIDTFFHGISDRPLACVKSCAIQFMNHVASVLGDMSTGSIEMQKNYEKLINSIDRTELNGITKDSVRKLFLHFEIHSSGDGIGKEITDRVINYIRQNFFNDLTLENVAQKFYISSGHLSRLMKKNCNFTFLDILTKIRIENAKFLLTTTDYKSYEVGDMVGFKNSKYFSQVFKKFTGKSPSEYK